MKLPFSLLLAVSCAFLSFPGHSHAEPMVGAYSAGKKITEDARKAAEFAVAAQAKHDARPFKLDAILTVQEQIVAGKNYKMRLRVTGPGKPRLATVVVYQALNLHLSLTSWEWLQEVAR